MVEMVEKILDFHFILASLLIMFLDAVASPSTYPSQWVSQSVIHSFRRDAITYPSFVFFEGNITILPLDDIGFSFALACSLNRLIGTTNRDTSKLCKILKCPLAVQFVRSCCPCFIV